LSEQVKQSELVTHSYAEKQSESANANLLKQRYAENENKLKSEYSDKITNLSNDLAASKLELLSRTLLMNELREELRLEKERALSELEEHHKRQVKSLAQISEAKESAYRRDFEEGHKRDMHAWEEKMALERNRQSEESSRLLEENENKLAKAKAFYENELQVKHFLM